jgi:hypothetical protein
MARIENNMQCEKTRICFMDEVRTGVISVSGLMIQTLNLLNFPRSVTFPVISTGMIKKVISSQVGLLNGQAAGEHLFLATGGPTIRSICSLI